MKDRKIKIATKRRRRKWKRQEGGELLLTLEEDSLCRIVWYLNSLITVFTLSDKKLHTSLYYLRKTRREIKQGSLDNSTQEHKWSTHPHTNTHNKHTHTCLNAWARTHTQANVLVHPYVFVARMFARTTTCSSRADVGLSVCVCVCGDDSS